MIAEAEYVFFLMFALCTVCLGVTYLKVKSGESMTITTPEFKLFQSKFLMGYLPVIFGEMVSVGSFFIILTDLDLTFAQITDLFLVSICSTLFAGVAVDVFDIGSKRNKCILCVSLYAFAAFSMFSGGHIEMLMLGRVAYGSAAALLQSIFESYAMQQHSSQGYPDDWLMDTFTRLAHGVAIASLSSGVVGQFVFSSLGGLAVPGVVLLVMIADAVFMMFIWENDINISKIMISTLSFSGSQLLRCVRSNAQVRRLLGVAAAVEAAIMIISFYWAPWITTSFGVTANAADASIPYLLVYSCLAMASMIGNYLTTILAPVYGHDAVFQALLATLTSAFFLGSIFQSHELVLLSSIVIHVCIGGYWPSIGMLRGRHVPPELRSITNTTIRALSLCLVVPILFCVHHSAFLVLLLCSCLCGGAAYLQFSSAQSDLTRDSDDMEAASR